MTGTHPSAGPAGTESEEPPFSPALVEEVLRQLDKAVKARQLYLANNPSYVNALVRARASFAPLWAETDTLVLGVAETHFTWSGVPVHQQEAKASDSLPWLFHKDGLREITILKGFENTELDRIIEIIPRVRRAQPDEDDLITLLWEQEFTLLSYRHVGLGHEGAAPLVAGGRGAQGGLPPGSSSASVTPEARAGAAAEPPRPDRPGVVKLEDFDSTLYFLDPKEIDYIKTEVEREYASDLRRAVLDTLLDIFELQSDPRVRAEVLQLLDQMVLNLLAAGRFETVAYLLRELPTVAQRATALEAAHSDQLLSLPRRLSDGPTLSQILQQLDEAASLPDAGDLSALFSELQGSALATIFEWLGRVRTPELRALLETAAARLATSNTADLVRLMTDGRGDVAAEAIRRAGALKVVAAVPVLARVLTDDARDIRMAGVAALVEIGSPGAMQMLERALTDSDRDVRMTAVRALGTRGQRSALPRLDTIVKSKEIRDADLTERMAFFVSYGQLCGEGGVPFLDGLLHGKSGLFGRHEDAELRACAAMALGNIKSPKAMQSLQKALNEKDVVVRNAVNRALRGATT
jgi:HEAT repeat protein